MSLEERLKYAAIKARHTNLLRPWYKKWWGILILLILVIVLVFLIASGIYVMNKIKEIKQGGTQADAQAQTQAYLAAVNGDGSDYFIGASNPKAVIIEFGDFACPFCLQSEPGLEQIIKTYPDKVKLVWRDYPLHETSVDLALGARCAGDQGQFWDFHDLLFSHQAQMATSTGADLTAQLKALAGTLSIDQTKFATCLDARQNLARIKKDYDDGVALQIQGTPTWFINNYPITGVIPADKFPGLIQGLIK